MPRFLSALARSLKRRIVTPPRILRVTGGVVVARQAGQSVSMRAWWLFAQVSVTPTDAGMPGGALVGRLLAWLAQLCLYGGVAAMFIGGLAAALSHRSGYSAGGSRGREIILGGVAAAVLGGLGPTIVNTLYAAAR
jgi:hypothetical protein